jgi:tRNA A37 threonylcarbamoyladenosine synthetase subunit TsaC/SUA5/YrdC
VQDLRETAKICVDCGRTSRGEPSTIVDVSDGTVEVIRKGAISQEEIEDALH